MAPVRPCEVRLAPDPAFHGFFFLGSCASADMLLFASRAVVSTDMLLFSFLGSSPRSAAAHRLSAGLVVSEFPCGDFGGTRGD